MNHLLEMSVLMPNSASQTEEKIMDKVLAVINEHRVKPHQMSMLIGAEVEDA